MITDGRNGQSPTPSAPERHPNLRLAQLVLLLDKVAPTGSQGLDTERLAYYDFFAANPFAVVSREDAVARAKLRHAAFAENQLSYASTGSRFANRRRRLQYDIARGVAFGVVEARSTGWGITLRGSEISESFTSLYAMQFRVSVSVVHARLRKLSDAQLNKQAKAWLRTPSLLLDLYESVELDSRMEGTAL